MEKINQFSVQRFMLLMQRYITLNSKTYLIGVGAVSGIIMIVGLFMAYFSDHYLNIQPLVTLGQVLIFLAGFAVTSSAYKELHTPARSQFFLTLPATAAEKLFSHWLITSVAYIIVANLLLFVVILLTNAIASLLWSIPINMFNPLSEDNLELMSIYLVVQSIFFLGAITFRKNNLLKTILSVFLFIMAINIITTIILYLFFGKIGVNVDFETVSPELEHFATEVLPTVLKVVFYGVIAPFCLLVSYFKLKEREV